jgi:RNA polymerase sigma-70 factor (ECF subfamily)
MKKDFAIEEFLLSEFQKGNDQALSYIMDNYHKPLCFYAYSLSNDYDGAKDIVQNIIINLWERRKALPKIKSFKSYLYKSVYNEFLNQIRTSSRMMVFEKEYFEALKDFVDDHDESKTKQQIALLHNEIEKLSPKCKETFLLCKREGLTYVEISDHLNISIKTVENHMIKAFSILRKKMKEKMNSLILLIFGSPKKIGSVEQN